MNFIINLNRWCFLGLLIISLIPFQFQLLFIILSLLVILFWLSSVSILGQKKIEIDFNIVRDTRIVKYLIFIIPILFFIDNILLNFVFNSIESFDYVDFFKIFNGLAIISSVSYLFFFSSKTLTILEQRRKVKFHEINKNFILIGFTLIGIWYIQPKLKELLGNLK